MLGAARFDGESDHGYNTRRSRRVESFEQDPRHRLYREYLGIIGSHWPSVFVMENVKGILSAKLDGEPIFPKILRDLQDPSAALGQTRRRFRYRIHSLVTQPNGLVGSGMKPSDYLIKCEDYGIPQMRHRVILLGIRDDLDVSNIPLLERSTTANLVDTIGDLPPLTPGLSRENDRLPIDALQCMNRQQWWFEMDSDPLLSEVKAEMRRCLNTARKSQRRGGNFVKSECLPKSSWHTDKRLKGVCNHESRGHIASDLWRYFFCACYARVVGKKRHGGAERSPQLRDFPPSLLPNHRNVPEAVTGQKFGDRFRVQAGSGLATTVTSHLSKDGHYFIHYDPRQYRSLTVREAARIQTFPDNYFFEGPRTQQYRQVGNAVPPFLARQIAGIVSALLRR